MANGDTTYIRIGRVRSIKPEFFKHEGLFDLEQETSLPIRLAYAGLWLQCDREGRFQWRPRALKTSVLPYDLVDFAQVLQALARGGFIVPYEINGEMYAYIPSWSTHQKPNHREQDSRLPDPTPESRAAASKQLGLALRSDFTASLPRDHAVPAPSPRSGDAETSIHGHARGEGKGREGKGTTPPTPPFRGGEILSALHLALKDDFNTAEIDMGTNGRNRAGIEQAIYDNYFRSNLSFENIDFENKLLFVSGSDREKLNTGLSKFNSRIQKLLEREIARLAQPEYVTSGHHLGWKLKIGTGNLN